MVTTAMRCPWLAFDATAMRTTPVPEPLDPDVIVTKLDPDEAVQAHPAGVVRVASTVAPDAGTVADD